MNAHLAAREPFRLDLTVTVLRRLPANPVEVWAPAGGSAPARYLRAFDTPRGPVAWSVTEDPAGGLAAQLSGPAGDAAPWLRRLARSLGTDVDLAPFYARARRFPAIAPLARAMRGVKPPRFSSLHEAFAGVILFQQVSLAAAMGMFRRLVLALVPAVDVGGVAVHPFPSAEAIAALSDAELRAVGMSGAKARALHAACEAIAAGRLREDELAALPSGELHERLLALDGVGPWTAGLLMLRGFGRIDRFPPGDVAAERLLRDLGSDASGKELLDALGDARGMLYYHLFLHRMARAGKGPFAPPPASEGGARSAPAEAASDSASAQRTTKGRTSRRSRDMRRGGAFPRATRRSSR